LPIRHGLKAMRGGVFRKEILERTIDPEKIVQSVLILPASEATADDPSFLGDAFFIRLEKRRLERGEHLLDVRSLGTGFLLGRHLAIMDPLKDALPLLEIPWLTRFEAEIQEVQIPFADHIVVAFEAVVFQKTIHGGRRKIRGGHLPDA